MKKLILALISVSLFGTAKAQFNIEYTDGTTSTTPGNIVVAGTTDAPTIQNIDPSRVRSISRYRRAAGDAIEMNSSLGAIYFGDFWNEGYGDYYFLLSNDKTGTNSSGNLVPMNDGGYILYVDIWSALSADHKNPVLPEGTYPFSTTRKNGIFTQEFSLLTINKGKEGTSYRIADREFNDGQIVVKHVAEGYDIRATVTTTVGETFNFHYTGPITFDDQTGIIDEPNNEFITTDVDIKPVLAQYMSYPKTSIDNYVLRLFDTTNISADGVHPNEPGTMLHLDIFTAKNAGFEGVYKAGTKIGQYTIKQEPGVYFPGSYTAGIPLGSHVERVNADLSVSHSAIIDGTVTITKTDNGQYHIVANLTTDQGKAVTCDWTGALTPFQ